MARQKTVRTNKAYVVDSWGELFVLVLKAARWVFRQGWRFRTELVAVGVVVGGYLEVRHQIGKQLATLVVLVGVGLVVGVPHSRRWVLGRLICSRTRRRLAAVFKETRVATASGKLPIVLRSRLTRSGEQYRLWLRIGQSAEVLDSRMEEIRAACRCQDVRIIRNERRSHLVMVEVIRREPLAGVVIDTPLVRYAAGLDAQAAASPAFPDPTDMERGER